MGPPPFIALKLALFMRLLLILTLLANFAFCLAEFLYGKSISSIALVSDSIDAFTDALVVLMGFVCLAIPLRSKVVQTRFGLFLLDDIFKWAN